MRTQMNFKEDEICELRKSAYGLVNAPYLWFQELREALIALKFSQCPWDPCLFSLPGPQGSIHGLSCRWWPCFWRYSLWENPSRSCKPNSIWISSSKTFRIRWNPNCFKMTMETPLWAQKKISKMERISIDGARRKKSILAISAEVRKVSTLLPIQNQLCHHSWSPWLQSIAWRCKAISWCSDKKIPSSIFPIRVCLFCYQRKTAFPKGSPIVLATDKGNLWKQTVLSSPIAGVQKKLIARSAHWPLRHTHCPMPLPGWNGFACCGIVNPDRNPPKSTTVVNCKSLFDVKVKNTTPQCKECRTLLEALVIKDRVQAGTQMHWIHSAAHLADSLTKVMDTSTWRSYLKHRKCCLHDMQAVLQDRAAKEHQKTWLKTQIEWDAGA